MDDQLLTVAEVAATARVKEETVRRWLRQRQLRGVCLSRKGGWRIQRTDLDAFLQDHANMPLGPAASTPRGDGTDGSDAMTLQQALDTSPNGAAVADLADAFHSRCRVTRKENGGVEFTVRATAPAFSTLFETHTFASLADLLAARPDLANRSWQPA